MKPVYAFVIVAAASFLTGARAQLINGIDAIVHDSVITHHEVDVLTEQTADVVVNRHRGQPDVLEKELSKLRQENLERQVQNDLILHEFKTAGYSLPESVLDDLVNERIKSDFGDQATLTKTLEARGITREKFRRQIRERFIIQQLRLKNISQEIVISPHKVETFYLAHRADFKVEDEVKLRIIVLNKSSDSNAPEARKLAEEILARLKEGAPFTEMATIYSQGAERSQGGERGWVPKGQLRKELDEVAFSLKPGQHSGVIETDQVCYLLLVEDARTSHFKSLGEVRDQIDKDLLQDEKNRLEKQWVDRLRKKTFVRYF